MSTLILAADTVRRRALRSALSVPPLRTAFADPALRIPLAFLGSLVFATVFGLAAPLCSLWLGAAVFGVPHVLSGLRHTAIRAGVEPVTRWCAIAGVAVGAAQVAGAGEWTMLVFIGLFGASAIAEIVGARPRGFSSAALVGLVGAGMVAGAWSPLLFVLVMTHLHAVASVVYFGVRAGQRGIRVWPVVGLAGLVALAAAAGAFDAWMPADLFAPRSAMASVVAEATRAVGQTPSFIWLRRGLFLYVLGQQLHFAVWLRLVPDVDRPVPVPWSFRRAWASLRADLGRWALPALAIGGASVPLILAGGGTGRDAYFALTYFHLGLEAAALVRLLARAPTAASRVVR